MICCLDLEGVLIPEIWINVARITGIEELKLTTRDEPNYDVLMRKRLAILKANKIKIHDIQNVVRKMKPLPGAKGFLKKLKAKFQVIILSDTFYGFADPLMKQLDHPTLFCNFLEINRAGYISNYRLRQRNGKEKAVRGFQKLGFQIRAAGDSYNDLTMLRAADLGVLFRPPASIVKENPKLLVTRTYDQLFKALSRKV